MKKNTESSTGQLSDDELGNIVGGVGTFTWTEGGIKYSCTHPNTNDHSFLSYYNGGSLCPETQRWCGPGCTYYKETNI